jgi:cytochrome c oxidase subunit 2
MIKFLVIIAIVLFIIAVAQLMRVFELASALKGGQREAVTEADNRMNGKLMMLFLIGFFVFCIWQLMENHDKLLPVAASVHGEELDTLFNVNLVIITIVFVITNIFLFYFAYKYAGRVGTKATFYPHNNKLELIWTTIPAIVLAFIIIYGLKSWNSIMSEPADTSMVIELYSKQFDWTARYAGADNKLGHSDYKLINDDANNPLGLDPNDKDNMDDIIVKGEFHIPVGKEVAFKFRSRDVIHSAYFPHFRAQMNTVPGMVTAFHFTPTITTKRMREITGNDKYDYIVLCNKICGASHYNMQITVVVDEEADYKKWIAEQESKRFSTVAKSLNGAGGSSNGVEKNIPATNDPNQAAPPGKSGTPDHTTEQKGPDAQVKPN